jgi:superfamily I DNA/RNA helicase
LRRSEKNIETADSRVRNVKELVADLDKTGAAIQSANDRLESFLEDITLDAEREDDKESTSDAVTLITMHSCKGLEYPHVFIVGLEDGLLPHSRSKVEGTLDEERRLFYVGITRAMQGLTLSHCQSRKKYGQAMPCHPSGFLQEIPTEFIERAEDKAKGPVKPAEGKSMFANLRESLG